MATINWLEDNPSSNSKVGDAPGFVRNIWSSTAVGMAESLEWPGSGGGSVASQGELKPGVSRTFSAALDSASSNADTPTFLARAFISSEVSRLYVYESDGTYRVGTPRLIERSIDSFGLPGAGRAESEVWLMQRGSFNATDPDISIINTSFPIIFSSNATVTVQLALSDLSYTYVVDTWPTNTTTGGFQSRLSYFGPGTPSIMTVYWEALGLVVGDAV